ncbi:MAG: YitT family protein, partial [Candidatus Cloacimonetes bacterium]|nr:YitT family protein [Candidatus Cloacimonadota bacterium]
TYFKEIKIEIIDKLNRGVTIFHTEGGFSEKQNKTLFCVLTRRQVGTLTDIVKDIDPDAFMILTDVSDVMGFGFKSRHLNLSDKKKKILK